MNTHDNPTETTPSRARTTARRMILIHPPAVSKRYLPTRFMPYGPAVIYAYLKEHGVSVEQHDFLMEYLFDSPEDIDYHNPDRSFGVDDFFSALSGRSDHERLERFVEKYTGRLPRGGRICAFSIVAYHQFWASLLLGRRIKEMNPTATIVFGGPFVTIKPTESLARYGVADYWVKGSGEAALLSLERALTGERSVSLRGVPGLAYYEGGTLVENERSETPPDEERPPDFDGLRLEQYRYDHPVTGRRTLFIPYRLSKGCPSRCSFCTGRLVDRYAHKSVDKIVGELLELSRKYETDHFMFADASVNGNPAALAEVCDRLIKEFPTIKWYAYARVRGFSPELLRKAKAAGCFSLFWGVESAYQPTVERLGKKFSVDEMYAAIDASIAAGIKNHIHLIYNAPHESEGDVQSFIRLVERYIDSDRVVFLPQRFLLEAQCLMFEHPERYGLEDVRPVETPIFEREQFAFGEVGASTAEEIAERNSRVRSALADHLDWIRYRNVQTACSSGFGRHIPARWLVYANKYAGRIPGARAVHDLLFRSVQSHRATEREQM